MDSGPSDIQTSDDAQDFDFVVRDSKGGHVRYSGGLYRGQYAGGSSLRRSSAASRL